MLRKKVEEEKLDGKMSKVLMLICLISAVIER
jgi:hypothetical protein